MTKFSDDILHNFRGLASRHVTSEYIYFRPIDSEGKKLNIVTGVPFFLGFSVVCANLTSRILALGIVFSFYKIFKSKQFTITLAGGAGVINILDSFQYLVPPCKLY